MNLRPYQSDLVARVKAEFKSGARSVLAVLGCGGGKSIIQADFAKSVTDKGNRVLFLVHRKELAEQITDTFAAYGVDLSLCTVGMVQTVVRRLQTTAEPDLIITDEAHHSTASTYLKIYEQFPRAFRIGFTATPWRLSGGGLNEVYERMVEGVATQWLINNNYLAPYKYYSVKLIDDNKLHRRSGEYIASEVEKLIQESAIYGDVIENYRKYAEGKKCIIYCSTVKTSQETVERFNQHGILSCHLDANTGNSERQKAIEDFRAGRITVLSNVDLFGEGFDVPDCECVILLRPTLSLSLHIQQSMRSMRYKPDKVAIIIDHVGNVFRHGLPDDVREWDLKGREKKKRSNSKCETFVKTCDNCFLTLKQGLTVCPYCGAELKTDEREIAQKQAELELIERDRLQKCDYNDYKKCETFDELRAFQKAKGYKFMWVIRKCIELGIDFDSKYMYMARKYAR